MKVNVKTKAIERLNKFGIRPSLQRIEVMSYLLKHYNHPTAETIFVNLFPQIPTLSKTTVYNTLKLLVRHGAIAEVNIDERNSRYDADISTHAHFKCSNCGYLCDVPVKKSKLLSIKKIGSLTISESQLYYKGYCEKCNNKLSKIINS